MSSAVLALLKINKKPAEKEEFKINVPIVDKSNEPGAATIRAEFIKKMRRNNPLAIAVQPTAAIQPILQETVETMDETISSEPIIPAALKEPIPLGPGLDIVKPKKRLVIRPKINVSTTEVGPAIDVEEITKDEPPVPVVEPPVPVVEPPVPVIVKPATKRLTIKPITKGVVKEFPLSMVRIGDADLAMRLSQKSAEKGPTVSASSYYMNNREIFINFMSSLFGKYKKELIIESKNAKCPTKGETEAFSLMTHQRIVRDYLNVYTPYRGLLLYHGLGSGKTCTSIAIAEGMKSTKQVLVMTPASLRTNYIEELKKCGDSLYQKNQFWEFINTKDNPDTDTELIDALSNVLSISVEFIKKTGGAWLVNMTKPTNYDELSTEERRQLDIQINEMISFKYRFINYNGMRMANLAILTDNFQKNPFDNMVVIIDEAHNFVSRIVNKLRVKKPTLSGKLYEYLMTAQNVKIILLTGTPIINYPNEIGIMFNILRGKIKTWYFQLDIQKAQKVDIKLFHEIFKSTVLGGNIMDFIEYKSSSTTLVITRNPFGFVNKTAKNQYLGVRVGDRGDIDDNTFVQLVTKILTQNGMIVMPSGTKVEHFKALPDTSEDFISYFIDAKNQVKNMEMFKRRILGLVSYFRSAQEGLMPAYEKSKDFHVIEIEMSDFQFKIYEKARVKERKVEAQNAKNKKKSSGAGGELFEEASSTYRIFSRLFCNFVFPEPAIMRPLPPRKIKPGDEIPGEENENENVDEDLIDATSLEEKSENTAYDADELVAMSEPGTVTAVALGTTSYEENLKKALMLLEKNKDKYLTPEALKTYSPKFLYILENINDPDHNGLHLIYSQFRTLEGIGILKLILENNGFAQFKLAREKVGWSIAVKPEDMAKPKFVLYTGTETAEEKEIVRNIFNGAWEYVPENIAKQLEKIAPNNINGEIIRIFMITASGAEGISLKNVRFVHIVEPYWHPVRTEQVIGRARRICSHQELPEQLRTVSVFLYLMKFSKDQLSTDESIELRQKDKSRINDSTPVTTDQALYEIATIKSDVTNSLLQAVKEASIDCDIHAKAGAKEQIKCFSFGAANVDKFTYHPSINEEDSDIVADRNKVVVKFKGKKIKLDGIEYVYDPVNGKVYDLDSYERGNPVEIGLFETVKNEGAEPTGKFTRI